MIKLLNGEEWNRVDLLSEMLDDEFYYGHLGKNALSSSACKKLLESPNAYRQSLRGSDSSTALKQGRLIHLAVLEPNRLDGLVVVDAKSVASRDYKEAVLNNGEDIVYKKSDYDNAMYVADAVLKNSEASFLLSECMFEVPAVKMIEGRAFRGKADALTTNGSMVIDLKTTSDDVKNFRYSARKYNYGLQAALYMKLFDASDFVFLVVNKQTKDIAIYEAGYEFLGQGEVDLYESIEIYNKWIDTPESDSLIRNYVHRGIL